jgi:hypothetical protein
MNKLAGMLYDALTFALFRPSGPRPVGELVVSEGD